MRVKGGKGKYCHRLSINRDYKVRDTQSLKMKRWWVRVVISSWKLISLIHRRI